MFFSIAPLSLVRRTWWITRIESAVVHGNYSDTEVHREVRTRVDTEEEAYLVASLTENGYHAPALDFDFTVETELLEDGVTRLSFPGRVVSAQRWDKLLKRMADLGMLRAGFETDEAVWMSPIGPLRNGMCIELAVPVHVLSSSTAGHHHVYIDVEMKWSKYWKLCKAMGDAGLLEREFVELAKSHGMSMLLKPGLTKLQLRARGIPLPGVIPQRQTLEYAKK